MFVGCAFLGLDASVVEGALPMDLFSPGVPAAQKEVSTRAYAGGDWRFFN
jgi:hypothetical protein